MFKASKLKINNVYTDEYGIKPKGRIEVPTPEQYVEQIEIKGRNGSLTKKYGYKVILLPVHFTILGDNFKKIFRKAKIHLLNAKTLIFDDDDEVFYKVKSVQIDTAENLVVKFGEFTVNFTLDPFMYEVDNPAETIISRTTINNPGYEAEPIMTVTCNGTGSIYINDQEITIQNINGTITIDSEMQNAYRIAGGYITNLNSHMIGKFPVLEHGDNVISFDGDISKIELIKNWRWV